MPTADSTIELATGSQAANVTQAGSPGSFRQASRPGPRRAVRIGNERELIAGVSDDESGGFGSNDASLVADVPPHWGKV